MILPYDPLREAILLELNWGICARRARGVSFDALEREYGLSKEVLYLIGTRIGTWSSVNEGDAPKPPQIASGRTV